MIESISADTGFAAGTPPPDSTTFSGNRGNIFENAENNAFTIASIGRQDIDVSNNKNMHTRIYSTNDATIILDELSMPIDSNNDTSTN